MEEAGALANGSFCGETASSDGVRSVSHGSSPFVGFDDSRAFPFFVFVISNIGAVRRVTMLG
jgi:hypothetical protein